MTKAKVELMKRKLFLPKVNRLNFACLFISIESENQGSFIKMQQIFENMNIIILKFLRRNKRFGRPK